MSEPTCINKTELINRGMIFAESTYKFSDQIFLLQICITALTQSILQFLLLPLGMPVFVSQLLGGIMIGPSFLGKFSGLKLLFPPEGSFKFQILGNFGCMFYLFLVGVKMDISIIRRSSKKDCILGFLTFVIPLALTVPLALILPMVLHPAATDSVLTETLKQLHVIAVLQSSTSFHVVTSFLADLKILNSELGRLATSVSIISGMCSWTTIIVFFIVKRSIENPKMKKLGFALSTLSLVVFITVVLRKFVHWIIKQTPKGESVKPIYLFAIFLMILATGFIGTCIGLRSHFGPMLFGLVIPGGLPLGSALTEKLEPLISGLFLPIYFDYIGGISSFGVFKNFPVTPWWMLLFSSLGFLGKFIGAIIPCIFLYRIPAKDAITLGVILGTLGTFDIATYLDALIRGYILSDIFTGMTIAALIISVLTSLIVRWLYNPSAKYIVQTNRTIQNVKDHSELRILACIYNDENVPTFINLFETLNPTTKNPLVIFVLHIIELHGRSTPLLISHGQENKLSGNSTPSDHVINCFRTYHKQNKSIVDVHPYTTITPFVSAHDDICTMALDGKTSLIIVPFHKQWNFNRVTESSKCRHVNQQVLDKAPCSVGILIDRDQQLRNSGPTISHWSAYNIGLVFLGGADDREALCIATRMAEHPNICLALHRLLVPVNNMINDMNQKMLDNNMINEYRLHNISNEHNLYREEIVKNGLAIVSTIRAMDTCYDLIIVGRHQHNYSSFLSGLTEWNEYPELGFFGDMFASSDFKGNNPILVVQQHLVDK